MPLSTCEYFGSFHSKPTDPGNCVERITNPTAELKLYNNVLNFCFLKPKMWAERCGIMDQTVGETSLIGERNKNPLFASS